MNHSQNNFTLNVLNTNLLLSVFYNIYPGTYPRVGRQKGALLRQTPALPTNIRLSWKVLPQTNTLAYYENP
jgi:hypothetical protein